MPNERPRLAPTEAIYVSALEWLPPPPDTRRARAWRWARRKPTPPSRFATAEAMARGAIDMLKREGYRLIVVEPIREQPSSVHHPAADLTEICVAVRDATDPRWVEHEASVFISGEIRHEAKRDEVTARAVDDMIAGALRELGGKLLGGILKRM